jgi:hypothetical protein
MLIKMKNKKSALNMSWEAIVAAIIFLIVLIIVIAIALPRITGNSGRISAKQCIALQQQNKICECLGGYLIRTWKDTCDPNTEKEVFGDFQDKQTPAKKCCEQLKEQDDNVFS